MNFYRSFYDVAGTLPETSRRKVVVAMLDLFFTGEEPSGLSRREAAVYNVCAGRISKSRQNAANVAARYASGGGVSKPTNAATDAVTDAATDAVTGAATKPRPEGEGEVKRERGGAGGRVRTDSAEPERAEVRAWFEANGHGMPTSRLREEADAFFDHFSAQGWVTGAGVPIVNWQAKARAWVARTLELRQREGARSSPRRAAPAADFSAYAATDGVVAHG